MGSGVNIPVGVNDKASGPLDRIRDRFERLGASGAVKNLASGMAMGAGIAAFDAFRGAVNGAADALGGMVQAAIADEESRNRLTASLRANVKGFDGNTDAIEENIRAAQRLGFSDEQLRDSLTVLVGATGDVGKAQEIMGLAMDFARYKGIDLRTASEALIKVQAGQYRALKQLGIEIEAGASATEAFAAVQKVTAGQAESYANTIAGAGAEMGIAFDEAGETIGTAFVPVIRAMLPAVRSFSTFVQDQLAPAIAAFIGLIRDNAGVLKVLAAALAGVVVQMIAMKAVGFGQALIGIMQAARGASVAVAGLGRAALVAQGAFALIGIAVMLLIENFDRVAQGVRVLAYHVVNGLLGLAEAASGIPGVGDAFKGLADTLRGVRDTIVADMAKAEEAINMKAAADKAATETADALAAGAPAVGAAADDLGDEIADGVESGGARAVEATRTTMYDVARQIRGAKDDLVSAVGEAFGALVGEAQVKDRLLINNSEIALEKRKANDKSLTAAERAEARVRLRDLRQEHYELLAQLSTYGSASEQITRTKALLTSNAMLKGLQSKEPEVRAFWNGVKTKAEERLEALANGVDGLAVATVNNYADVLKRQRQDNSAVDKGATAVAAQVRVGLDEHGRKKAGAWGAALTKAYANGMTARDALQTFLARLGFIGRLVSAYLEGHSPPREGPLSQIDKWGEGVGAAWAQGLARGAATFVPPALAGGMGGLAGALAPAAAGALGAPGGGAGGVVVNVPIQNFYGTQGNVDELSRQIAHRTRLALYGGKR